MKSIILLPIVLFAYLYAQRPDGDNCCPKEVVGRYNCSSNCFYSLMEDASTKFCFKPGMFESKCAADGGMTMTTMSGGGMSSQGGSDMPSTPPMPGASSPMPGGGSTSGGSGGQTTAANPGGPAETRTLTLRYTWDQEPSGADRSAQVDIPATAAGQKVPVVLHLHGNGGQGNTAPFKSFLGDDCIIVAPNGYERSWNVYYEKSKADDVQFILDLIAKVGV